jgi:hypothetical protein
VDIDGVRVPDLATYNWFVGSAGLAGWRRDPTVRPTEALARHHHPRRAFATEPGREADIGVPHDGSRHAESVSPPSLAVARPLRSALLPCRRLNNMYMHMSGLRDRAIAASMAAWIDEG